LRISSACTYGVDEIEYQPPSGAKSHYQTLSASSATLLAEFPIYNRNSYMNFNFRGLPCRSQTENRGKSSAKDRRKRQPSLLLPRLNSVSQPLNHASDPVTLEGIHVRSTKFPSQIHLLLSHSPSQLNHLHTSPPPPLSPLTNTNPPGTISARHTTLNPNQKNQAPHSVDSDQTDPTELQPNSIRCSLRYRLHKPKLGEQ
jgi:hypothetical protein